MKRKIFKAPSGASIPFTQLGFGTAPLGNLYRPMTESQATDVLEAMWKTGHRYIDTAPLYGLGLSETQRLCDFNQGWAVARGLRASATHWYWQIL